MITFNGFLNPKYEPLLRSMKKKYVPKPRPLDMSSGGALGKFKKNLRIGSMVMIKERDDQPAGQQSHGQVIKILTPRDFHPLGIKVMLDSGRVGRVQQILVY